MSGDISLDVIKNTQKILGKYVKKPPLTDKLLRKPPFRFLHDIVTSVINETGFLKGLYNDVELRSDNIKERDAKISFLQKLIDAIKAIAGVKLVVRPNKIIAGMEPTDTNLLLQAIGTALDKKLDSSDYIATLKSENNSTKKSSNKPKVTEKKPEKVKVTKEQTKSNIGKGEFQKVASTPRTKKDSSNKSSNKGTAKIRKDVNETPRKKKMISPKEEILAEKQNTVQLNENSEEALVQLETEDSNKNETKEGNVDTEVLESMTQKTEKEKDKLEENAKENTTMERPKSARPKSRYLRQEAEEVPALNTETNPKDELKARINSHAITRPKSSLRPPSVRPMSARPGAPRLRSETPLPLEEVIPLGNVNVIIENHSDKADEEETVVIQPGLQVEFQQPVLNMPADKGHLVEQILEQLPEDADIEHSTQRVDIEWEQEALRNIGSANKDIEQTRVVIQTLTRSVNPLGKLVNYLHEDVEAMQAELEMWTNVTRQTTSEIAAQKRIIDEASKPLQAQLEELQENIEKMQQQILSVRFNTLRNDLRIQELMCK